ncbi:hypothetical protein KL905_003552 [Ogataea polymorpha]|nr:hypothetical protein KL907_003464 [Ogataea polymorpha]KAG7919687.1 hypothetical protein KL905_003552 [Ogataea polymorpha]KAG7932865.1 hypothetical protein KL934_003520 [Ogataea polymorpha]
MANVSQEFRDLCQACRKGDVELVNQLDEWDYSPLILASICGHEKVVRLLLEKGAIVNRDTFEGSRAIYGALTDAIRSLLLSYDITKAVDVTQPFASHISALLQRPPIATADVRIGEFRLHRFLLTVMSRYFSQPNVDFGGTSAQVLRFLFEYIYLVPSLDLKGVDVDELRHVADQTDLTYMRVAVDMILAQTSAADINKTKNTVQHTMYETARQKLKILVEGIVSNKIVKDTELTAAEKRALVAPWHADLIFRAQAGSRTLHYAVHRAIFSRAEYYLTLFASGFHDTAVFGELEKDGVVDLERLHAEADAIPVISLPSSDMMEISEETVEILLKHLYFDEANVPPQFAMETLVIADALFIDRLKTIAAISLSSIEDFSTVSFSVYDVLRAAWEFKVHRLEDRVAYLIAQDLEAFCADPQFCDIILESSRRISERQEFDTIELVDDIRFYLAKKHAIDQDGGTLNPTMARVESDEYLERVRQYEQDIRAVDSILEELGLNA